MQSCCANRWLAGLVMLLAFWVPAASGFDFEDVKALAQERAGQAYKPPPAVPGFLGKLSYDEYRQIRFKPEHSWWRPSHSSFQVMPVAPGMFYRHVINLHVIDAEGVHQVPFRKHDFDWPTAELRQRVPGDLGYAGFRLTYPLNGEDIQNQFLSFAGVSYFRAVGRGENFGLSARGLAIDTGLASGETFPVFTDFWLVRPGPDATAARIYALLDGPSVVGAYQFIVHPGDVTRLDVSAHLILRKDVKLLGLAPLTSMFHYGRNTPRPVGSWRGAVHDSDGLLIHAGNGEWLWHPLTNPVALETEYLRTDAPQGFGLLQRERDFSVYQDAEARYGNRPSAWVQPEGDWGEGNVVLVKIPTDSEYNDNIVAFWTPRARARASATYDIAYRLSFGLAGLSGIPLARTRHSFVGREGQEGRYRFVVDFAGGPLQELATDAPVHASVTALNGGKVLHQDVRYVAASGMWRLSMLIQAPEDENLGLRAYLGTANEALSETWTYTLAPDNRMTSDER